MKEGWKYLNFADCIDKVPKQQQVKTKDYKSFGKYPIVSQEKELISGYWDDESILYKHIKPIIIFGDHTKEIKFIDFDFVVGADGTQILCTKENIDAKFFYYALKATPIRNLGYARHFKLLKEKQFPVPPLPEQQRIVEYLDSQFAKIEALKANAAQQLQAAKDLFQSALKDLMTPKDGWEEIELIKIFNFIDYRGKTPTKIESGIPLITAKNVKYGYIDYTIRDYISKEEYELRKSRGISRKGDLLFTTEAPLGNVAIADLEEFSAGQRIITLQQYNNSKYSVDNKFYYYYILSPFFQKKIKKLATGATAQGIKAKILKTITVPVLSLSEQQQIADTLDDISNKIKALQSNYEQTITLCSDLKQSLLKQIFE